MPRYNRGARLDPDQVQDVRGRRLGPGLAVGGGGLGLLVLIVSLLLGANPLDTVTSPVSDGSQGGNGEIATQCQTGADAEERQDCRIVLFVNSIQEYWSAAVGPRYQQARTQIFTQATQTGCGFASSQVGPFYCPVDTMVYLDLTFFDELERRFGARGGPFAQAYVLAHEYGHHIQNLAGTLERSRDGDTGPQSNAVRVELQADCFAGVWAANAVETGYIIELTDEDIREGLDAAAAVGDDRIQAATQGQVRPEAWTHGSAEQRQRWFTNGYRSGDPRACDTFSGSV